jgi:hypothetical protein
VKAIDVDALLTHLELHYSDWAIAQDMDCVRPLVTGWQLDVIEEYAKARRKAPGFWERDPKANNHNRISREAWDRINAKRKVGWTDTREAREVACGSCGATFLAKRSTARFCGDRCRQRASRDVTLTSPKITSVGLSANDSNSVISETAIPGVFDGLSVTGSAA